MAYIFGSIWDRFNRNALNNLSKSVEHQGKSIQDLVAKGQLTPSQYATLIQTVNNLVSKGSITESDLDKNNFKLDATFFASDFLNDLSNGVINTTKLLPASVTKSHVANKAISPDKTNFVTVGKNKIDDSKFKDGYRIYVADGSEMVAENYKLLGPFDLMSNTTYTQNMSTDIAFYDSEGEFISALPQIIPYVKRTFKTPSGTVSAKTSLYKIYAPIGSYQIELGSTSTPYEKYKINVKGLEYVPAENEFLGTSIKDGSISSNKVDFFVPEVEMSSNIFDINKARMGYYVSETSGSIQPNASYTVSDFMEIKESHISFIENDLLRMAFYDKDKKYITGFLNPESPKMVAPGTEYVVVSILTSEVNTFQVAEGSILPAYKPYGFKIKNLITEEDNENEMIINLPDKIYSVVGEELNLYFDNVINGKDTDYNFDVDFEGKGQQFEDFFRFLPDQKETRTLKLKVIKNNKFIAEQTTNVIVSTKTSGSGTTRSVVIIGDSTTNNGITVTKLNENFGNDSMNIATLGTRGNAPNKHEGRSGWTARMFIGTQSFGGVTNAFYNPSTNKFDFSYYLTNNSITRPDYVIINLGINDMFSVSSDASLENKMDEAIADFETMINSIKANSATIKIGLALTIPPNYSQDAFAKDYSTGQTRWRYKRNNILWVNRMIEHFSNKEAQNIYLIPTNSVIDTKHNYGFVEEKVNARSEITRQVSAANGGVHPVASGYWQIADAYWFWLKSFES